MGFELEDIIKRVQALIAKADHPNTPPAEAETCRTKAEILMQRYRIEETAVGTPEQGFVPQWLDYNIVRTGNEFAMDYRVMFAMVVDHFDCKAAMDVAVVADLDEHLLPTGDKSHWYVAHVCGYASDLRFMEAMATAIFLGFKKRLEPQYDPELSEQVNAYLMRKAGMEGRRIAMAIYGRDDKNLRPKVRKMYEREALARGENPKVLLGQGVNVKQWRKDYAQGFYVEMYNRLARMRAAANTGVGLVPVSRKDAVIEAYYTRFPHLRPQPRKAAIGDGYAECAKCRKAKSGFCRDHAWRRPRKQEDKTNYSAVRAGAEAARAVDLGEGRKELQ